MKSLFSRSTLNKTLALGGVIIILLQTLMIAWEQMEVAIILVGILINQVGVWGLAGRLLPDRRMYVELRTEVRRFMDLVPQLNAHAVAKDDAGFESTKALMHETIDRMASVAAVRAKAE